MPNRGINFLDSSKLRAEVKGRNSGEKISTVVLDRVRLEDGSFRTYIKCCCGYPGRDGVCDRAVLAAEEGGAAHVFELFPICRRSSSWRLQYPLDVEFEVPSIREASVGGATEVRAELGLAATGTLLPMVAIGRSAGRPKKEPNARQSKYSLLQKSSATRATVNNLGNLVYLPTDKCSACGQQGHDSRTCRGKGFIKSSVDRVVAAIYREREQDINAAAVEDAALNARLAARVYTDTDPVDHTQDTSDTMHENDAGKPADADSQVDVGGLEAAEDEEADPDGNDSDSEVIVGSDEDSEEAADDRCDYRAFYDTLGGSTMMRGGFSYKKNCRENRTKPVQCARCMKDHHTLCFKKADQWNDQDTRELRSLTKDQTLCWECYQDDEEI
jgi:hypothetical protein